MNGWHVVNLWAGDRLYGSVEAEFQNGTNVGTILFPAATESVTLTSFTASSPGFASFGSLGQTALIAVGDTPSFPPGTIQLSVLTPAPGQK